MKTISVAELLGEDAKHLHFKLLYGRPVLEQKLIDSFRIQKPGLALAGYTKHIHEGRVQILGNTEICYLESLEPEHRKQVLREFCKTNIPCLVVTKSLATPPELLAVVKEAGIPLLKTSMKSSNAITEISSFLEDKLAPETLKHGVLMDVYGVGVVIAGRSGIGKSECAIELIKRGHRLVADDAIYVKRKQGFVVGSGNSMLPNHLELRGVGILNVKDMFGVTAIRIQKRIELIIEFVDWDPKAEYDRLGLQRESINILDVSIPHIVCPVSPGRNMAVIVEAASRNHLLKIMGYDSAADFVAVQSEMTRKKVRKTAKPFLRIKGVE